MARAIYTVDVIRNHKKTIYISSVMFVEEYMNIYIQIKIVYIRNLYGKILHILNFIENFSSLQCMYDKAAFQQIV